MKLLFDVLDLLEAQLRLVTHISGSEFIFKLPGYCLSLGGTAGASRQIPKLCYESAPSIAYGQPPKSQETAGA